MEEPRFEALYAGARDRLWSYLYRITGEAALADDLTQEAFCRVFQVADAQVQPGNERAYLFRVATNLANDHYRRQGRLRRYVAALLGGPSGADPRGAHEMQALFQRLRPRERALLWLAHVEGYAHREIAAILDLRPGSVRVLLSRARKRLAELVGAGAGEGEGEAARSRLLDGRGALEPARLEALEEITPRGLR
jgi:RNA polymerase sigma-70 factor (ECF subfamily)